MDPAGSPRATRVDGPGRSRRHARSSTNDANGASVVLPVMTRPSATSFSRVAPRSIT